MNARYSAEAEEDPADIYAYSQTQWGFAQAEKYLDGLSDTIDLLERMPSIGRDCGFIQPGMHRLEKGRHVIFYRMNGRELRILRILHDREVPDIRHFPDTEIR